MAAKFGNDLEFSKFIEGTPLWPSVYAQAFPDYQNLTLVDNLALQKQGVDRTILTELGKLLNLEEKADKWPPNNLFLEHISSAEDKTPGWMEKDSLTDYLSYAFPYYGVAYVFRFKYLKRAWEANREDWIERYEKAVWNKPYEGRGYTSKGCAVPIVEVRKALGKIVPTILAIREYKFEEIPD